MAVDPLWSSGFLQTPSASAKEPVYSIFRPETSLLHSIRCVFINIIAVLWCADDKVRNWWRKIQMHFLICVCRNQLMSRELGLLLLFHRKLWPTRTPSSQRVAKKQIVQSRFVFWRFIVVGCGGAQLKIYFRILLRRWNTVSGLLSFRIAAWWMLRWGRGVKLRSCFAYHKKCLISLFWKNDVKWLIDFFPLPANGTRPSRLIWDLPCKLQENSSIRPGRKDNLIGLNRRKVKRSIQVNTSNQKLPVER